MIHVLFLKKFEGQDFIANGLDLGKKTQFFPMAIGIVLKYLRKGLPSKDNFYNSFINQIYK